MFRTKHLNNLSKYILFASEIIFDFQSHEILSNFNEFLSAIRVIIHHKYGYKELIYL